MLQELQTQVASAKAVTNDYTRLDKSFSELSDDHHQLTLDYEDLKARE